MSLTNTNNEKQKLEEWAAKNSDERVFDEVSNNTNSYWVMREENITDLYEYDFKTLPEFENLCRNIWKNTIDEEIMKIVAVSVFKYQFESTAAVVEKEEIETSGSLPEYIYVF